MCARPSAAFESQKKFCRGRPLLYGDEYDVVKPGFNERRRLNADTYRPIVKTGDRPPKGESKNQSLFTALNEDIKDKAVAPRGRAPALIPPVINGGVLTSNIL
ncbi:hypothetical protein EVAR_61430_1 [Eumeta japonica]|uniref:Uncharacterized protein n=1 Tax=Eumeta variegata TaxID=151549 RepID=A0A4C1Y7V2_EUMVA|nr:hypothetical protein EVAR_61430_1 [Eumeta japonica]